MKKIMYLLYGGVYRVFSVFRRNPNKVLLYMGHQCHFQGNIRFFYEELKRKNPSYQFIIMSKAEMFSEGKEENKGLYKIIDKMKGMFTFYFILNYHFATATIIALNDNFLPLAYMPMEEKVKLIQLWHGVGAFKRFGLSTEKNQLVRELVSRGNKQVTNLFVSSEYVVPYYEEALHIAREKIFVTGVPVCDYYFDEKMKEEKLESIKQNYPEVKGKKVILYAPTFRNTEEENRYLIDQFPFEEIKKKFGEKYLVFLRVHPTFSVDISQDKRFINVTDYPDIKDLYLLSDLLITDYSSCMVEYLLLGKPIIFYAYDMEKYDRGFYWNYEKEAPGKIVRSKEELLEVMEHPISEEEKERRQAFREKQYKYLDCENTKRVVDILFNEQ